jgi:hypothetical protein
VRESCFAQPQFEQESARFINLAATSRAYKHRHFPL